MTWSVLGDGRAQRADVLPERKKHWNRTRQNQQTGEPLAPWPPCYYCTAAERQPLCATRDRTEDQTEQVTLCVISSCTSALCVCLKNNIYILNPSSAKTLVSSGTVGMWENPHRWWWTKICLTSLFLKSSLWHNELSLMRFRHFFPPKLSSWETAFLWSHSDLNLILI